jgi:hypothetical protein
VPWFLAGSVFPISALPGFLAWFAKFLPLTHGLALVRYGLLGDSTGLHNIWNLQSTTMMAGLSLAVVAVVAVVAAALTTISIRVSALQSAERCGPKKRHLTEIPWRTSYPETSSSLYQTKSPRLRAFPQGRPGNKPARLRRDAHSQTCALILDQSYALHEMPVRWEDPDSDSLAHI